MGKRTNGIERVIDETRLTITATAWTQPSDDQPKVYGREVVLHVPLVSDTVIDYAALHGLSKRLEDAAAKSAGTSLDAKLDDVQELVTHYESGADSWNVKGKGKAVNVDDMLAKLLANDPTRLAAIMAAAQSAIDQKAANATG